VDNRISYRVYGRYALFTDPITKLGGEKCSYQIPTYQAIRGITESIYWKPTITWHIEKIRVIKKIRTQSHAAKPINYSLGGHMLSIYSYLYDVEYQVQAHFEWNMTRKDMENDRNENKHFFAAKRMLERGGRRDIFLGTRECQGYVEPCTFGEGHGEYDGYGSLSFGLMVHGFDYPSDTGKNELSVRLWSPVMKDGVIQFIRPEECIMRTKIRDMVPTKPTSPGLTEKELLQDYNG
jgi:CRISPR-associated protein Cas5d